MGEHITAIPDQLDRCALGPNAAQAHTPEAAMQQLDDNGLNREAGGAGDPDGVADVQLGGKFRVPVAM